MPIKKEEIHDVKITLTMLSNVCTLDELKIFYDTAIEVGLGPQTKVNYQANVPGLTVSRSKIEELL